MPIPASPAQPGSPAILLSPSLTLIPTRRLGWTQMVVPVLGLGGAASPLSRPGEEAEAIAILEQAYTGGIRYPVFHPQS